MAALQSEAGKKIIGVLGLPAPLPDSMIFIKGHRCWLESDAALQVAAELGSWWNACRLFWLIPRFLRNAVYRLVAKNRYRIWGKNPQCYLPSPEWKSRFLDLEEH